MARPHHVAESLRRFGLALPGTREDHPWGEVVLKAKDKVFVFLGRADEEALRFSVKLPRSSERLLDQEYAAPTGYGLGKSGWVTLTFDSRNVPPDAELFAFLEESYRAVASKTLLKELDARGAAAPLEKATVAKTPVAKPPARRSATRRKRPAK